MNTRELPLDILRVLHNLPGKYTKQALMRIEETGFNLPAHPLVRKAIIDAVNEMYREFLLTLGIEE